VEITRAVNSFFRMDAARANPRAERYSFSCFAGIRIPGQPDWPQVLSTSSRWSGNVGPHPGGDTLPFLDLWCDSMGMAIGEMPAPGQGAHLFLEVAPDKRVEMGFENAAPVILKPGESHTLPRSFLMVHHGDFQGALDRYRQFQTLLRGEKILAP
jgi:alpha-galactosidase